MNKRITVVSLIVFLLPLTIFSQHAFQGGEWFKFRIHYGPFNASYATLEVKDEVLNNKKVFHVVGKGKSTGLLHLFFKVDDDYETYIDKKSSLPYRFIRKIDEGGYTKDIQIDFNQDLSKAYVLDRKKNSNTTYTTEKEVHDMISSFYYIRNELNGMTLNAGDVIDLNMFFDKENHNFKIKFLGSEILNTKFGKIATLKFRPYVMAGRVFKEKESLTFWVSADKNKMPVKIQADLAVGSLDADIEAFKGIKHPLQIIMD